MASSGCEDQQGQEEESFLYFAYGSNLLSERIHLRNPSAAFCCVARLQVSAPARLCGVATPPTRAPAAALLGKPTSPSPAVLDPSHGAPLRTFLQLLLPTWAAAPVH